MLLQQHHLCPVVTCLDLLVAFLSGYTVVAVGVSVAVFTHGSSANTIH